MRTLTQFCIALISIGLFSGCEKEQEIEQFSFSRMEQYAGLSLLNESHFREDSLVFKIGPAGLEIDTITQFLRRVVLGTVDNLEGNKSWVIGMMRYEWGNQDEPVTAILTTGTIKGNTFQTVENNHQITNLVFPPSLNKRWDGLSFFNSDDFILDVRNEPLRVYKDWPDFRIIQVGETLTVGDREIHDVITVLHVDSENAIERRYSLEKYAPDLGIVYKEQIILDTQNITNDPWEEKAERGYMLKWTLLP